MKNFENSVKFKKNAGELEKQEQNLC